MLKPKRIEKFWKMVDKQSDSLCWEWKATIDARGYGRFRYEHGQYAHRFSWILAHGDIPKGMVICHRCDNPKCVNPNHLFVGTQQDNVVDMWNKGRHTHKCGVIKYTFETLQQMADMRDRGSTYKTIGLKFGMSFQYVHYLLSTRYKNIIQSDHSVVSNNIIDHSQQPVRKIEATWTPIPAELSV